MDVSQNIFLFAVAPARNSYYSTKETTLTSRDVPLNRANIKFDNYADDLLFVISIQYLRLPYLCYSLNFIAMENFYIKDTLKK